MPNRFWQKRHLEGLKRMKKANAYAKQLLAEHPDATDAYIARHRQLRIGSQSGGTRVALWFGGVHGDKKLGMEQVARTAENGRYLRPFAKIILALAARREKQDALAQKLFRELTSSIRKTNNSRPNTPKPWTRRYSQTKHGESSESDVAS